MLGKRPLGQLVDGQVTNHVVHAVQRFAQGRGQGLGRADTHRQRTDQTRTRSDRDCIHVRQGHPGLVEGSVERRQERLQMGARRNLRDDTAVAGILVHRRSRAINQQLRATHQADARLVAR